jgi:hypothetical protein
MLWSASIYEVVHQLLQANCVSVAAPQIGTLISTTSCSDLVPNSAHFDLPNRKLHVPAIAALTSCSQERYGCLCIIQRRNI